MTQIVASQKLTNVETVKRILPSLPSTFTLDDIYNELQQGLSQPIDGARSADSLCKRRDIVEQVRQRVMRNKRRVANERNQVVDDFGEERLVLEELARQAVDGGGLGGHVALGIEIAMKALPARNAIDELDAADLHQSVPLEGIKPRRLGIEHDFAHVYVPASAPAAMGGMTNLMAVEGLNGFG